MAAYWSSDQGFRYRCRKSLIDCSDALSQTYVYHGVASLTIGQEMILLTQMDLIEDRLESDSHV